MDVVQRPVDIALLEWERRNHTLSIVLAVLQYAHPDGIDASLKYRKALAIYVCLQLSLRTS